MSQAHHKKRVKPCENVTNGSLPAITCGAGKLKSGYVAVIFPWRAIYRLDKGEKIFYYSLYSKYYLF